jgi:hypothetical protein
MLKGKLNDANYKIKEIHVDYEKISVESSELEILMNQQRELFIQEKGNASQISILV